MRLNLIAAMDSARGIGKENAIPWHIPGELPRFKAITMGHPIVMGRKTFQSIGRALPGRTNIVITRAPDFVADDCKVVGSLEEALKLAGTEDEEVFVIGGAQIYKQALPEADTLYLTLIEGDHDSDTFFPPYEGQFTETQREKHEHDGHRYAFVTLERPS